MANESGLQGRNQVYGHRGGQAEPIDSVDDGGTERLAVDAAISGVAEINLDETSDEVAVYGGVDGSETADAATRQIINVNSSGFVRVDDGGASISIDDGGGSITVDGDVSIQSTASHTEDTAHNTGDTGFFVLGVRNDGAAARTSTDGDYGPVSTDSAGRVGVTDLGGTLTVDQSTHDNFNANANIQVQNADVTASNPVPAQLSDGTDTATVTAAGELNVIASAQPGTDIGDVTVNNGSGASAVNIQDGGNSITVDDGSGSLTVDNAALSVTGGGTEAGALRVTVASDSTGVVSVDDNGTTLSVDDGGSSLTVDGTVTVQDGGSTISIDDGGGSITIDTAGGAFDVQGTIAHDGVDSGNPIKVGYKAIAHGSSPTAVAASDRTDAYANRHGIPWVIGGHPNVQTIRATYTTAQTNAAIVTVGAGTKIVVTRVEATLDEATEVGVQFRIGFGATTTPTTTGVVSTHPGLVPGSIYQSGGGAGILGVGADGEDLRITSEVPTSGTLDVVVSYYEVPS